MANKSDNFRVPGWVQAPVSSIHQWTENLFSVRLDTRLSAFEAGQYTWLADGDADADAATLQAIAQPYSILSAPTDNALEFFFYTQIGGELSRRLARLQVGDNVWVKQSAEGNLTLSCVNDAETLCLLATGTGVAPFISMLATNNPWQRFKRVVLVYAVRHWQDLRYREFFEELKKRYPLQFELIAFVSREPVPAAETNAVNGHIPASLESGELETKAGVILTPHNSQIMLCGNPGMVKDAIAVLQARGFSDNKPAGSGQLSYEAYW
jgi:ferredoxin/flavodoxin---NADP+ reductase